MGQITKYLGVTYKWGNDENGPFVIASMERNAKEIIEYYEKVMERSAKLAATPGFQNTALNKSEGNNYVGRIYVFGRKVIILYNQSWSGLWKCS